MNSSEVEAAGVDKPLDIVVTCMDYRIDTAALLRSLGVTAGAYVLRNAGGVVTEDVIRSLLMHQFAIVHRRDTSISVVTHTDCGMRSPGDDRLKSDIEADIWIAQSPPFSLETFPSPELGVRRSVQRLRASPFLPDKSATRVRGYVYEIDFVGRLREVTTYVVQTGDTLTDIATRFGVPLQELIAANPQVRDPNLIGTGQVIVIPSAAAPSEPSTAPFYDTHNFAGNRPAGGRWATATSVSYAASFLSKDGVESKVGPWCEPINPGRYAWTKVTQIPTGAHGQVGARGLYRQFSGTSDDRPQVIARLNDNATTDYQDINL